MPTFTSIALDNLFEPRVRDTQKKPFHWERDEADPVKAAPRHLYISPGLYVTPDQAPIPDHSLPYPPSPSPYVVNLKRRRAGNVGRVEVLEFPSGNEVDVLSSEEVGDNFVDEVVAGYDEPGEEEEGFQDLRSEAMSVGSEVEVNDFGTNQIESRSFVSAQGEFFDAIEDFSTDSSVSNVHTCCSRTESELHATRLSLLEEIEKRKNAEENLVSMHTQWERIRNLMSEAGLTFPAPPVANGSIPQDNNLMDQISQEVVVSRFVAEAIGRGQARAEAEEAALSVIEMKDQEISRLRDRLQYYETVNHEMSQRKLVEVARKQQERKKRRRRWLWGFMGLSITIGASFVAYSYFPQSAEIISLLKPADSTDASSASAPETS
ncbi:protein kinase superfamily protein [Striga asiatica]|uniref:Protein kinase superfamily protein n=1 Tax=Striga asiatica TaxID=4170 RepID=A0A5A7R2B3_STRAF|nr:protein kinase superfamily protein [Striga asiatica]